MDVSPRKKPPFSPRKGTRAASPDDSDEETFGAVNRPLGMALLLRSVYSVGSPITTTSAIPIAQKVVDALLEADCNLPSVTLKPFSHTKISTSCYVLPAHNPDEPDEVPRFDILETWRETLRKAKPEWEIVWQPLAEGKDKRMCVRFGDAGFKKE
jgi:hypothetical protein